MKKLAITIFFDAFALMLLGLVIVLSASSTYSLNRFDSVFYLFNSHLFKVILSISFLILFSFVPYELYKGYSKAAIFIMIGVLVFTLIAAPNIKGAARWLNLWLFSIQPADLAKLVLVIHLAYMLDQKHDLLDDYRHVYIPMFLWIVAISSLIIVQPNFSTGILIILISLSLLYVGGARLKHIMISTLMFISSGGIVAMIYPHTRERIFSFFNAIFNGGVPNLQVKQALYSLGSGGIFGVGIGNSMQSNLFLPEAYGDFIFAILGEETGFIGTVFVIACYLLLFISGILIAKKARDRFGQLLAFGITISIVSYALVNMAVTTGLMPTTGLPLPFISYGGTSLLFVCIGIGILINIALSNQKKSDSVDDDISGHPLAEVET
ncbi:putative lipid II flippase FtsW [bacterium BMS3Abin03]|jgi:cell division protein FtsW|nr:putative lipid II flippase FtsW [bacterium BMS3Abin03]MCG6958986.1 putative lipid II flippase FtsW [bacterium BMS3Abin03]